MNKKSKIKLATTAALALAAGGIVMAAGSLGGRTSGTGSGVQTTGTSSSGGALRLASYAVPQATAATSCTAGTWVVTDPDPNDTVNSALPVQYQSQHFAIRYANGVVTAANAKAAADQLEATWTQFMGPVSFPEPYCTSATKLKTNVFIGADYGLSGGTDGQGHMGMWIGPGAAQDHWGLAHEFTHALQGSTGGLQNSPYSGWIWETHANWMAHQMPENRSNVHCSVLSVNYSHLYFGSTRVRYCDWQFLEYLKDRFGYKAVADIWAKAPKQGSSAQATGDPVQVLMGNQGWTVEQLNDAFGDWAMHNVNWDYKNPDGTDQGAIYRQNYGGYEPQVDDRLLRSTILDPIDLSQRRFSVPATWAPQRWGYNVVKLYPDTGATSVTVTFRGIVQSASATSKLPGLANEPGMIPPPASGWRWGLVAIGSDGTSRYSALQKGSDGATTIAVRSGDQGLYMIVVGAPTQFQHIQWDQPYYSIYRFPWMVQFAGAMPANYQPNAPTPIAGGHKHPNGGGWVAANASVASTAYVGPYARVLSGTVSGNARIEDHAVVYGGTVSGSARASALSVIRGNTLLKDNARAATTFLGLGEYEHNIVLSGTAQNVGDVEQRGASFSKGVYYGFVDQDAATDAGRGANLTAPVPEVTAAPTYTWRP